MGALEDTELNLLSVMYEGDKNRDASDKIRGFLFQDYVTIMCLLQDHVECVCSEYLEDVDVFYEDGRFEFIQVKYYPKTYAKSKMKEISTDLYYQYLRLQMLQSTLQAVPKLYIHTESRVTKPTLEEMKTGKTIPPLPPYDASLKAANWLRTNVYTLKTKDGQKNTLFSKMASDDSIKAFLGAYQISDKPDINRYKNELMDELNRAYPNPDKHGDVLRWKSILLGLAITCVQRRYTLDDTDFKEICINKKDFDMYIKKATSTKTEQNIASYLVDVVCQEYGVILDENKESFSELQAVILEQIFQNTVSWINEIGATVEGQYQLVNTFSTEDADRIADYKKRDIDGRLVEIAQCFDNFKLFLDYLWKIMLNICQEKVHSVSEIFSKKDLICPSYYINTSVKEYVCLNFPDDKFVRNSVILPPAGRKPDSTRLKFMARMVKLSPKPRKWYFENDGQLYGKSYYDYSVTNVNENPTVADPEEDSFYIECMNCIGIDAGKWCIPETCSDCIFSEKCVREETNR